MADHNDAGARLASVLRWGYAGLPALRRAHESKDAGMDSAKSLAAGTAARPGGTMARPWEAKTGIDPSVQAPKSIQPSPQTTKPISPVPAVSPSRSPAASHTGDDSLDAFCRRVQTCTACELCKTRRTAVPGSGSLHPQVLILGSSPGPDEDGLGKPFSGAAGQYLDKWLEAIYLDRYRYCFLSYVLHCRSDAQKSSVEPFLEACRPYLAELVEILKPKAILCVGKEAMDWVSGEGSWTFDGPAKDFMGLPVFVSHEPGDVLREPALKRQVWETLKRMKAQYLP